MSAPASDPFDPEGLVVWFDGLDGHQLAEVVKAAAHAVRARKIAGASVLFDVAFEIHEVTTRGHLREYYERYMKATMGGYRPVKLPPDESAARCPVCGRSSEPHQS